MIRDLLNPSSGFLDLREDSKGVIQVAGITEVSTINAQEVRWAKPCTTWFIYFYENTQISSMATASPAKNSACVLLDHGIADEGEQTAHPGAHSRQSDIVSLPRCAAGGRQAAEPLSRCPAGGPLRTPLHDRPCRLWTSSTGVCVHILSQEVFKWLKSIRSCTGGELFNVCEYSDFLTNLSSSSKT